VEWRKSEKAIGGCRVFVFVLLSIMRWSAVVFLFAGIAGTAGGRHHPHPAESGLSGGEQLESSARQELQQQRDAQLQRFDAVVHHVDQFRDTFSVQMSESMQQKALQISGKLAKESDFVGKIYSGAVVRGGQQCKQAT
jgi:hypothetical protein